MRDVNLTVCVLVVCAGVRTSAGSHQTAVSPGDETDEAES